MKRTLIILATIFLMATTAPASYIDIDFTGSAFMGADNQEDFSFSPPSSGLTMDFTPGPAGATLSWETGDGLGVRYDYEWDEIEGAEWLRLDFTPNVFLFEIRITDLFNESGYLEMGSLIINDSITLPPFFADPGQTGGTLGELSLIFDGSQQVESIIFRAPGRDEGQEHEYSVAGVKVKAVPIPGAAWMLGSGLVGLVLIRRRFKN